jgi:peroxiredoxin
MPAGWDAIPGARGCSQEACSFRDNLAGLKARGAEQILALSTDPTDYQQELVRRLHLPYLMLSDPTLSLRQALDLPTFGASGRMLYKRLTMIVRGDAIEHVFYPIFPPNTHGSEVLEWLESNPLPRA